MSETIRCARCDKRLAMEDAEPVVIDDGTDDPWQTPAPDTPKVYLLICAECAAASADTEGAT